MIFFIPVYSIRYCDYVRESFYENNKFQSSAPYDILKGLYHEDLAILDQLCAEFISQCFTHTKKNAPLKLCRRYQSKTIREP